MRARDSWARVSSRRDHRIESDRSGHSGCSRPAPYSRLVPVAARAVVWAARVGWLAVAIVGGAAIGEALSEHGRAVQVIGTAGAWTGWAVGAVALAVPSVVTLTAVRVVVPGSVVVAAIVLIDRADPTTGIALLAPALATSVLVATAEFGRGYIQASAYGAESRFGLRPPIGYLLACAGTWLPTVVALVLALPALAGQAWILGTACLVVAAVGLVLLPRRWHQLSRRWLVLVPAGIVVHDPVVLADTLMLARRSVVAVALDDLGAATQKAADLTGPTPGLAVVIHLDEAVTAVLAPTPAHRDGRTIHLTALVVSPTRPGAVVRAVAKAGYPPAPG
jgi:hypothetical protein